MQYVNFILIDAETNYFKIMITSLQCELLTEIMIYIQISVTIDFFINGLRIGG